MKKGKKLLAITLSCAMLMTAATGMIAAADTYPPEAMATSSNPGMFLPEIAKVVVNGIELDFDVPPTIVDDRTLVQIRPIAETLGWTVGWEDSNHSVTITNKDASTNIFVMEGSNVMMVNGLSHVLDVPAMILYERTMLPLRAIAEAMDLEVNWDDASHTVSIGSNNNLPNPIVTYSSLDALEKAYGIGIDGIKNSNAAAVSYSLIDSKVAQIDYNYLEHQASDSKSVVYRETVTNEAGRDANISGINDATVVDMKTTPEGIEVYRMVSPGGNYVTWSRILSNDTYKLYSISGDADVDTLFAMVYIPDVVIAPGPQVPNPIVEYETSEAMYDAFGYYVSDILIDGMKHTRFAVIDGDVAQVDYEYKKNATDYNVSVRMSIDEKEGVDNSGIHGAVADTSDSDYQIFNYEDTTYIIWSVELNNKFRNYSITATGGTKSSRTELLKECVSNMTIIVD